MVLFCWEPSNLLLAIVFGCLEVLEFDYSNSNPECEFESTALVFRFLRWYRSRQIFLMTPAPGSIPWVESSGDTNPA